MLSDVNALAASRGSSMSSGSARMIAYSCGGVGGSFSLPGFSVELVAGLDDGTL